MKYTIYSDGAARGNPGPAGAGYAVYDETGALVHSAAIALGNTTNNVAEYTALLEAAKYVRTLSPESALFLLDSELVVKQLHGEYKVKAPHLIPLFNQTISALSGMKHECRHVPRAQNKVADKLANEGADRSER
jgi:ribonuclease HI